MSQSIIDLSRRAFIGGAAALGATSLIIPEFAFAETAAEKQAEADAVRNQLVGLQADLETAGENYYAALDEQESAQRSMEEQQVKIDETTEEIEGLQDRLSTRARSMYRSGSTTFIDFLLGASSFAEFTQNWELLNQINANDADLVDQTKAAREQLQAAKDEFARQEQIAAQKAAECKQIHDEVQVKVQNATDLMNSLDEEARALLEQEQAAAAAAAAAQAQAEAEAAAAAAGGNGGGNQGGGSNDGGNQGGGNDGGYQGGGGNDGGGNGGGGSTIVYPGGGGSAGDNSAAYSYACSRIGCPYVWGAEGPDSFDCSGLVTWAYRQLGIELPHQSEAQMARATRVVSVSEARPGDVLWRYGHVGIAGGYGGTPYVHAPTFGACVRNTDSLSWSNFTNALQF
ncbi:coiled-coil domain-containing protein [Senegalimassilia anaerobia]|uniref:Hydrolase Nlp/P60 n=1 Tax=Senegalimassilia anaerobia TaxID=1473216 RepID=A0A369LAE4_9ACTN|nr:C40 family peptidase [Senegalimassilia anaerobia]RDB56144.1 hydrolase Nlp/P60 [Senegalimassilia anaerobia]